MRRVLFYSSVNSKKQFSIQNFYRTDVNILKRLGYKVSLCKTFLMFFRFWSYDIAFIYFYRFGLFPAVIAKLFRKKVIFTGGIDFLDRAYAGKWRYFIQLVFFRLCNLFSTHCIVVSKSDIMNIKSIYFGTPPKNIVYIPHSIDCDVFLHPPDVKKEKIITTICWMGRKENVTRKGVDRTILSFKNIILKFPDFRLYIIGPLGPATDYINELINENGLESTIHLTGNISEDEKISHLKRSKYYFQLSEYEGFGIAAIEALITGNIVFHSGKGGLKDSVGDEGVLIDDIYNYKLIADTFCEIESNGISDFKIKNQIKYVIDNFDLEIRVNGFKQLLA